MRIIGDKHSKVEVSDRDRSMTYMQGECSHVCAGPVR